MGSKLIDDARGQDDSAHHHKNTTATIVMWAILYIRIPFLGPQYSTAPLEWDPQTNPNVENCPCGDDNRKPPNPTAAAPEAPLHLFWFSFWPPHRPTPPVRLGIHV